MRPLLKPALRRLWRDDHTLQLGVDPQRAVVLGGLGEVHVRWLDRLDGSCDERAWLAGAMADGLSRREAEQLLGVLADADALEDSADPLSALGTLLPEDRDRLAPDLAALTLLTPGQSAADCGPAGVIGRRQAALIEVRGLGRVGSALCALLAAAGIGHVLPVDAAGTARADAAPGGLRARDAGLSRERATRRAVQRAAPHTRTDVTDRTPTVAVLAGPTPASGDAAALVRDGVVHLVVAVVETTAVVGPLVVPGATACVRCLDLHRSDRDPAWPRLLAQLAAPAPAEAACDVVLAAMATAAAAQQVLAFIDSAGAQLPAAASGTLELSSPGWRFRRRSWVPHPACGCCWQQSVRGDTMAG